ncbi:N-acyl-D-amino-acid deacylase family protein [Catenulispora acidiphila]|uniref:N-acyl-D-amino-acid deacylase family protein n=1 Tax=Catenulispora acidiphila TaxID=304895 RepID=UPI001CBAB36F|nr:amidohydrolase family protein [Catenulispora acidiphila]
MLPPGTFPHDAGPFTELIDVSGLVVAPGFIDAHTHSDTASIDAAEGLLDEAQVYASVLQGVTTEIAGNCGHSAFPGRYAGFDALGRAHSVVGRANHLASLVGHGTLRAAVVGEEARAARAAEIAWMAEALDEALTAGAVGFSTGLIYTPGSYADTAEITALAAVAARHGKPYVTHLRDEMSGVEGALEEAVAIARDSGAALHVSHHKTAGKYAWGRTEVTLARLAALRESGMDVTCDVYPYTAGSTALAAMLPPWAHDGGKDQLLKRLRDPAQRDSLRKAIAEGVPGWENTVGNGGWDRIAVAGAPHHPTYQGHTIAELAAAAGTDALDLVADLLLGEDGDVTIISHSMREDDVQRVLTAPFTMIGSDGVPTPGLPHPRWAGTFTRVLGHYTRDLNLLPLPEAIRKMTTAPATRFNLPHRGTLRTGAHADITVFDPAHVADRATFAEPRRTPEGVHLVIVDGTIVVRDGALTGARPGQVLRC